MSDCYSFMEFVSYIYGDTENIEVVDTTLPEFRNFYNGDTLYIPYIDSLQTLIVSNIISDIDMDNNNRCHIVNPYHVPINYV